MGNRAIIKTRTGHIGLYLHWNGGRDSVEAFLRYCDLRGFRSPETDGYGWARMAQVIGNFFGGGLSLGVVEVSGDHDGAECDNGAYIIEKWQIVGREDYDGPEQNEYDLLEMLNAIDDAQPEPERIGAYLRAYDKPTADIKIGDAVVLMDYAGKVETLAVVGFGKRGQIENGQDVSGKPYVNKYGSSDPGDNINNYILTDTVKVPMPETAKQDNTSEEEQTTPAEIFINEQLKGIEIKFKSKPDTATRDALKAAGFRWHSKKCVWYAKNDPTHMDKAREIVKAAI